MNRIHRRGYIRAKNSGEKTVVSYCRPKNSNDLKRDGRVLSITSNGFSVKLNGTQIRSLRKVLAEVGEI
jgi:hypothetical protein